MPLLEINSWIDSYLKSTGTKRNVDNQASNTTHYIVKQRYSEFKKQQQKGA
ncbi:hypothetical protein [Mergibacter septicus]|uniref:hypothetical protein n=1 Tax=Mergibacter septicus TaxID=221402 RepID=UPI00223FA04D|nr:hypothetical protein [Mergibacter septicus]